MGISCPQIMEGITMSKSWLFAAAAVLALSLPTLASAGSSPADPTKGTTQNPVNGAAKLKNTVVVYAGASGITLASGFNNLDSGSTLNCAASSCTITGEDMVQVEAGTAGTLWAICVLVDGAYANPGCPYQGAA